MTTTLQTTALYFGSDIAHSNTDVLNLANEIALVQRIKQEDPHIITLLRNYKRMQTVDARAAAELKKKLPYFIGASFKNGIRSAANFEQINYLVLDLDDLKRSREDLDNLKKVLATDTQLLMCFISPSGNGLKCVFKLAQPIFNTVKYSQFYKSFAMQFAAQNGLAEFVDYSTCDVTRVCFIANDANIYYNENAECIAVSITSDEDGGVKVDPVKIPSGVADKQLLTDDVYKQIALKLNPNTIVKRPKQIYVPAELNLIHHIIEEALAKHDFSIKEVRDINYGKKYVITHKLHTAEMNIYYGKQGFQVIKSPKNGTNPNFNDAVCLIATQAINMGWTNTVFP